MPHAHSGESAARVFFFFSFMNCASVRQTAKLVAALLRVAGVTAGLAESSGSLPSGL